MDLETEILGLKQQLTTICQILNDFPNKIYVVAENRPPDKKTKYRRATKDDIWRQLTHKWNLEHPNYPVK